MPQFEHMPKDLADMTEPERAAHEASIRAYYSRRLAIGFSAAALATGGAFALHETHNGGKVDLLTSVAAGIFGVTAGSATKHFVIYRRFRREAEDRWTLLDRSAQN